MVEKWEVKYQLTSERDTKWLLGLQFFNNKGVVNKLIKAQVGKSKNEMDCIIAEQANTIKDVYHKVNIGSYHKMRVSRVKTKKT